MQLLSVLPAAALLVLLPAAAVAQDADALAKQTQNPVASLVSVPLQGNWDFGLGDRDATASLLNIQPVMPFPVSRSTNVILRVIMPLTSQPAADGTRLNGLGDVLSSAFFSPARLGVSSGVPGRRSCCQRQPATDSAAKNSASVRRQLGLSSRASGPSAFCSTTSGPSAEPPIAAMSPRRFCSRSSTTTWAAASRWE